MAKTTCSKCGNELDRVGYRYCRACHAAYMRENRKKNSELPPEAKMRQYARAYARVYLTRGLIKRGPCESCGAQKAEMHHDDYTKPTQIRWLCRACHLAHHRHEMLHVKPPAAGISHPHTHEPSA